MVVNYVQKKQHLIDKYMTPKEKAKELVNQYKNAIILFDDNIDSKKCAFIAANQVQQLIKDLSTCKNRFIYIIDEMNYWIEVKQEINKL
jgi:hypothetical protein